MRPSLSNVVLPTAQIALILSVFWLIGFPHRPEWFANWVFKPLFFVALMPGTWVQLHKTPGQLYRQLRDGQTPRMKTVERCATVAGLLGAVWLAFH